MSELSVLKSVTRDPAILAASLVANLLSLAVPLAMLQIYDRVIPNQAYETLTVLSAMVAVALLIDCLLRLSRARLLAFFAARFEQLAYSRALWALIMEDPSRKERVDRGTLVTRISAIDRLRSQRADSAAGAILDLPFAALFLVLMAILSPIVAATVGAILGITFLLLRVLRSRTDKERRARFETEARRYSFITEVLSGIRSIRTLHIGALMNRRQERLLARSAGQTQDMTRLIHQAQGLTAAIGSLIPVVTAATAGYLVINGDASIGVLAAVVVLSGRIVQPVLRVEGYLSSLETSRQSEADLRALTEAPLRAEGDLPLSKVESLELRNLATHPDPDTGVVISDLNLTLSPGDCLLLQSNDARQLTVATRLFMGELAVQNGEMLVNGQEISRYRLQDRQDRIRILAKDAQLLEGTVFDNICAFRPDLHREKALAFAKYMGLQKILRRNPRGLQTLVRADSEGLPQSAQRIAANIAGLITLPDIVVFHTANSGLDHETDARLLAWLKRRASRHILILVSNRPSYKALATKTLVLNDGIPPQIKVV